MPTVAVATTFFNREWDILERSHRIDNDEFRSKHRFQALGEAQSALARWEAKYNHERFSMALAGLTPAERLAIRLAA